MNHHDANDNLPDGSSALADAASVLEQTYVDVMRHEPQLRRFTRALDDLGLPVPSDWAAFDDEQTVSFRSITAKQFQRLVNLLERIAETQPDEYSYEPGPNDVPLFEVVSAITAAQRNTTSNAGAGTSHANDADDAG